VLGDHVVFYFGAGCEQCNGTGYQGRISVNEVLVATSPIRDAILRRAGAGEIKQIAIESGMTTMLEDGFRKATEGTTTLEEILRVIYE
jgi:type II secretory ATPase GspE/PulE/Tfp pilus assembly ATPase PilB-like protein